MPATKSKIDAEKELVRNLKGLTHHLEKLKDFELLQVFKNPWKFMWYSFLKGLMVGFGSVLGATVVVAVVIFLLAKISFLPFVGEYITDIIEQVQGPNIK